MAKHRNGSVKDIDMSFVPEYTTFYDATEQQGMDGGEDYQYGSDDDDGGPQVADFGSF